MGAGSSWWRGGGAASALYPTAACLRTDEGAHIPVRRRGGKLTYLPSRNPQRWRAVYFPTHKRRGALPGTPARGPEVKLNPRRRGNGLVGAVRWELRGPSR